jgi:mRNA interferase HicA
LLTRKLRALGWWVYRQGGRHEIWTNGKDTESVPRHKEVSENTARVILQRAAERSVKGEMQ